MVYFQTRTTILNIILMKVLESRHQFQKRFGYRSKFTLLPQCIYVYMNIYFFTLVQNLLYYFEIYFCVILMCYNKVSQIQTLKFESTFSQTRDQLSQQFWQHNNNMVYFHLNFYSTQHILSVLLIPKLYDLFFIKYYFIYQIL